jgi:hypothetical protein
LGLDILNATNAPIIVKVGTDTKVVEPGLSFRGRFLGVGTFSITGGNCVRTYPFPNLDTRPWRFLIGKSIKFRALPSGILLAYPPTPDVELENNPLRAMTGSEVKLRPIRQTCR